MTADANRYAALLRGINVGGNNVITMTDLRERFSSLGFGNVQTHIQSGNVVFSARPDVTIAGAVATIEGVLRERFNSESRVAVFSADEFRDIVGDAPPGFGTEPDLFRYDVLFVLRPVMPAAVVDVLTMKDGVDAAHAGRHAVYFRRLLSCAAQSHLSRLVQRPIYKDVTVRNWNTTIRLLSMVGDKPRHL